MLGMLTQSRLKELLHFAPDTGKFKWRVQRGSMWPGDEAGCVTLFGKSEKHAGAWRCVICIDGRNYMRARLAWLYMTGAWPVEVDHKDGDSTNDIWDNLREATHSQNQANRRLFRNNKARERGVHFRRDMGRWRAMISKDGRNRHIGYFDTKEAAAEAWRFEAARVHGEFLRAA